MSKKKPNHDSALDEAIADVLAEMKVLNSDSSEYERMVNQLEKLYKMKHSSRISADQMFNTLTNAFVSLSGIGMIIGYEHAHAIGSKALNFVKKP